MLEENTPRKSLVLWRNIKLGPWALRICDFTKTVSRKPLFHNLSTTAAKLEQKHTKLQTTIKCCSRDYLKNEQAHIRFADFLERSNLGLCFNMDAPGAFSCDFNPVQGQCLQFACNEDKTNQKKTFPEEARETMCTSNRWHKS